MVLAIGARSASERCKTHGGALEIKKIQERGRTNSGVLHTFKRCKGRGPLHAFLAWQGRGGRAGQGALNMRRSTRLACCKGHEMLQALHAGGAKALAPSKARKGCKKRAALQTLHIRAGGARA